MKELKTVDRKESGSFERHEDDDVVVVEQEPDADKPLAVRLDQDDNIKFSRNNINNVF